MAFIYKAYTVQSFFLRRSPKVQKKLKKAPTLLSMGHFYPSVEIRGCQRALSGFRPLTGTLTLGSSKELGHHLLVCVLWKNFKKCALGDKKGLRAVSSSPAPQC